MKPIAWMHLNEPRVKTAEGTWRLKLAGEIWPDLPEPYRSCPMETYMLAGAVDFAGIADTIAISTRFAFRHSLLDWGDMLPRNVKYVPGLNLHPSKSLFDLSHWSEVAEFLDSCAADTVLLDLEDVFRAGKFTLSEWNDCAIDWDAKTHAKPLRKQWEDVCDVIHTIGKSVWMHHPVIMPDTTDYPNRWEITTEMVEILVETCSNVTIIDPTVAYVQPDAERHVSMVAAVGGDDRLLRQMLVAPTEAPHSTGPGKDYWSVDNAAAYLASMPTDRRIVFTDGIRWTAVAREWANI